jgi:hypothetical protein
LQVITRQGINLTPQQFVERFDMLQQVTGVRDAKQQAVLVRSLRHHPGAFKLLPPTLQDKATALKQQLLQQLGVDPEQTQQLISSHPSVLSSYKADSLVHKATEQGQLLGLEAAGEVSVVDPHSKLDKSQHTAAAEEAGTAAAATAAVYVASRRAAAGAVSTKFGCVFYS